MLSGGLKSPGDEGEGEQDRIGMVGVMAPFRGGAKFEVRVTSASQTGGLKTMWMVMVMSLARVIMQRRGNHGS